MSKQRRGHVFAGEPPVPAGHLLAANGHIADLLKAVRPHEERSSLTPRERITATRALSSLAALAEAQVGAPTLAAFLYGDLSAWSALLQVDSVAVRMVAEAGNAARAAANSRHPERSAISASSSEVPKASSAEAWAEAMQYSSGLLGTLLAMELEDPPPDPSQHPSDSNERRDACIAARILQRGYSLASALLRSGALPALSRLLAAEAHRGIAAVLDTDTVMQTLQPLTRLIRLAVARPRETLWLGQGVGKAQLGPAVLRELSASGVVEHVCRFAVTRLAGQQAGGGTAGLGTRKLNKHLDCVMKLLHGVTCYAIKALQGRGEVAAEARAVLSSPCYQYFVHLHVVSQLHALDGGTTYGLPYDKLLQPVRAEGAEAGWGGPIVLDCTGLRTAFELWRTRESGEGTYLHTQRGRRVVLDLLLRVAGAALESGNYFAASSGRCRSSSSSSAGGRGSGRGASAAGSSQGQPSAAPGPAPVPAAVVKVDEYPSHSLAVLVCALVIGTGRCAEPDGSAGSSSGSSSGSGSHGAGGPSAAAFDSGAGAGSSSGGSGACLGGSQEGQAGGSAGPTVAWPWWRRRCNHDRWWRLAVRAVHAEVDNGGDWINPTFSLKQMLIAMGSLWGTAETLDTGASRPAASMPRPARSWLSAAVSAGYLPCLERLTRTMASPACTYPVAAEERAAMVLELLQGRGLAVLALHGEEQEAAALVVTAVKATAGLASAVKATVVMFGGGASEWSPLEVFTDIPSGLRCMFREQGLGEDSSDGGRLPAHQRTRQARLLRLLSLCLARWLPLCAALLPRARAEAGAGTGAEARVGSEAAVGAGALLRTGRGMVRLVGLARGTAEGRGDARAAESWERLLAACGELAAGEGTGGADAGEDDRDLPAIAALLPPPCDVSVLPWCSNPLCTSLEGDSEAGLQLVACGGRCGGAGCGGEGPCCCRACVVERGSWHAAA